MDFFNFDNIGAKIKSFTKWACRIEIVLLWVACVAAVAVAFINRLSVSVFFVALLAAVVGPFVLWVLNWFVFAFGELVESAVKVRGRLRDIRLRAEERTQPLAYTAMPRDGACEDCGARGDDVYECVIQDSSGTRYRKLCPRCVEKCEAQVLRS